MELFIMRHGHAEPEAPQDSLRVLSVEGQIEARNAVKAKSENLTNVQRVIHSPYARAQQTARIALDILGDIPSVETELLVPYGSVGKIVEHLHKVVHEEKLNSVMIVGHQPLLGSLVDELCGLEPGVHRLATASIAAIDTEVLAVGCCQLRWIHHVL